MVLDTCGLELTLVYKLGDCGLVGFCVVTGNGDRVSPWCVFSLAATENIKRLHADHGANAMAIWHSYQQSRLSCLQAALVYADTYGLDQPVSLVSDSPMVGVQF